MLLKFQSKGMKVYCFNMVIVIICRDFVGLEHAKTFFAVFNVNKLKEITEEVSILYCIERLSGFVHLTC